MHHMYYTNKNTHVKTRTDIQINKHNVAYTSATTTKHIMMQMPPNSASCLGAHVLSLLLFKKPLAIAEPGRHDTEKS